MISLRPYQQQGVDEIRQAFRDARQRVIYVAPTGSGKTILFSYITAHGAARGTRIAVVVHRIELLRQTCAALVKFNVPHGVIHPDYSPSDELVQVGTVQTMIRRQAKPFDLLILDEAHHAVAGQWDKLMAAHPQARVLGVTATPCRLAGRGLGDVFEHMILGPSVRELTDSGYLTPAQVYAPPIPCSLKGVRSRGGDYSKDDLQAILDRREITGSVIEHYRKYLNGLPSVAFCASVEHAKHVADEFQAAGFRSAAVYGSMPAAERDDHMGALASGRLSVLTSCDLISEGVDVPGIVGGIILRPTKSTGLWIQQIGRCLRVAPGKTSAIILDHVGNSLRHGLPDTPREWTLDEGIVRKKTDDGPRIRQCAKCYFIHELSNRCPQCGYEYPVKERKVAKQKPGDLVLVSPEEGHKLYQEAMKIRNWHQRHQALVRYCHATGKNARAAYFMASRKPRRIEEAV